MFRTLNQTDVNHKIHYIMLGAEDVVVVGAQAEEDPHHPEAALSMPVVLPLLGRGYPHQGSSSPMPRREQKHEFS